MELHRTIEHTLLKPDANSTMVEQLCNEAVQYDFWGVCVHSSWVPFVHKVLGPKRKQKIISVVGFPLGAGLSRAKAYEAEEALHAGADEIDMVIHLGWLKENALGLVAQDLQTVVKACSKATLKVIIETGCLTQEEKIAATRLVKDCGAQFVKTCTGFQVGAATVEDVELIRAVLGEGSCGIKASGGIKSAAFAEQLLKAGATRIGTSASVQIVTSAGSSGTTGY